MKTLKDYILTEKLKLNAKSKVVEYNYQPKDGDDLRSLMEELLDERGKDANLNDIDTSAIKNMSYLFEDLDPHNIDISGWDVSNVENMQYMFAGCENFNCDLSKWDVSNVTDMESIFHECHSFRGNGIENWDVRKVIDFNCAFFDCENFDKDLNSWKVNKRADLAGMFEFCKLKKFPSWYKE